jgi:hypothetical protein
LRDVCRSGLHPLQRWEASTSPFNPDEGFPLRGERTIIRICGSNSLSRHGLVLSTKGIRFHFPARISAEPLAVRGGVLDCYLYALRWRWMLHIYIIGSYQKKSCISSAGKEPCVTTQQDHAPEACVVEFLIHTIGSKNSQWTLHFRIRESNKSENGQI